MDDEEGRVEGTKEPEGDGPGGKVAVGTSGYSFADWVGNFYPTGTKKGDMLREYVKHFACVEVNSTYYRIPHPVVLRKMEEKTPEGFEFVIKANQEMTHKLSKDKAVYEIFKEAIQPVIDAGKFSGVIAQFPWGFKYTPENTDHLKFIKEQFSEYPLFAEFRNSGWMIKGLFAALRANGIGYCAVDEPRLKGLIPPVADVTTDIGYVRLHGRNAKNWWGRGGGDRYDYLYSEEELKEWVTKIKAMSQKARKTFVFFNNCHAGQAATNAALMKELLSLPF
jgi:uncharacterized protein YecE (DUF72 family)